MTAKFAVGYKVSVFHSDVECPGASLDMYPYWSEAFEP